MTNMDDNLHPVVVIGFDRCMEGGINAVNPQDIENISALKDAAVSSICGACVPLV